MRAVFWRGNAKKLSFWFTLICSPPFLESFAHEFFLNKTSWFCCPQKVVREKFLHFAEVDKTMRFAEATMSEFLSSSKSWIFRILSGDGLQCQPMAKLPKVEVPLYWVSAQGDVGGGRGDTLPIFGKLAHHQVHSHTLKSISGYLFLNVLFLFLREPERNMYFAVSSV